MNEIPSTASQAFLAAIVVLLGSSAGLIASAHAAPLIWTSIPVGIQLRLTYDPHRKALYAAADASSGVSQPTGLLASFDGGEKWRRLDEGSFASDLVVVAPTPDRLFSEARGRLIQSLDGGKQWENVGSEVFGSIEGLWIDPAAPSKLYLRTRSGPTDETDEQTSLWFSEDGGGIFRTISAPGAVPGKETDRMLDIYFVAGQACALGVKRSGLYCRRAGDKSWQRMKAGPGVPTQTDSSLVFARENTLAVKTEAGICLLSVHRDQVKLDRCLELGRTIFDVIVHPANVFPVFVLIGWPKGGNTLARAGF